MKRQTKDEMPYYCGHWIRFPQDAVSDGVTVALFDAHGEPIVKIQLPGDVLRNVTYREFVAVPR